MLAALLAMAPQLPADAAGPDQCPWKLHLDANTTNVAFPDQNANYYTLAIPSALDTSLTITGRFPHARYMSFTTYTGQTQAIDGINDVHIVPDSTHAVDNPFIVSNARNTEGAIRDYQVTVLKGQRPANPATNTVYTADAKNTHSNLGSFIVIYRTYRPDQAYPNDGGGGEQLPTVIENRIVGGPMQLGDSSQCSTAPDPNLGVNSFLADTTLPIFPVGMINCYPGQNPPAWHRFTNLFTAEIQGTSNECFGDNNPQTSVTPALDANLPAGGFLENLDNKYIAAILNIDNFPAPGTPNVMVVRSKVPTTPDTFNNVPVMPNCGSVCQLRYWSMCSNEGLSTRFYACVMDDGLTRLTTTGDYCLVVSRTGSRPRNANTPHKVNWLPFGVAHDNVLIERNMLPDPGFTQAIQNVAPGNEQQGLGSFYPTSSYMTVADFEKSGCPGFGSTTRFGALPGDIPGGGLPNTGSAPVGPRAMLALAAMGLLALVLLAVRRRTDAGSWRRPPG